MSISGLSFITVMGIILAVTGAVGNIFYIARYRRTSRDMNHSQASEEDSEMPSNTFASLYMLNGFLHIGMLLLILGGVGLIYYGSR